MLKKLFATMCIVGILGSAVGTANAAPFSESFNDGFPPAGWSIDNLNSTPGGTTTWFKGEPAIFAAQSGAPDSYAAANFNAAGFGGNIRDWLISPTISVMNGAMLSFFTRTELLGFNDTLQVRMCKNAACTLPFSTANFSTILLPTFTVPDAWTQETATISGLSAGDTVRIAFGYLCNDTSVNCNYVGIDSVTAVPEPSMLLVFALGLTSLGWSLRRNGIR